ncbi:hypothetical protein D3C76_1622840 [compost metagenome]
MNRLNMTPMLHQGIIHLNATRTDLPVGFSAPTPNLACCEVTGLDDEDPPRTNNNMINLRIA